MKLTAASASMKTATASPRMAGSRNAATCHRIVPQRIRRCKPPPRFAGATPPSLIDFSRQVCRPRAPPPSLQGRPLWAREGPGFRARRRHRRAVRPRPPPCGGRRRPEHAWHLSGKRNDIYAHRNRHASARSRSTTAATGARRRSARSATSRSAGKSSRCPIVRALGIVKRAAAESQHGAGPASTPRSATPSSPPPRK